MSVIIGQASIDEHGKISGGNPGDQSGRELNTSNWYAYNWTFVLRIKSDEKAQKAARMCRDIIKSGRCGYDQSNRNSLRKELKAANWNPLNARLSETDCSALMAVCAEGAGCNMDAAYSGGNAPATFQMRKQYAKTNEFDLLTDRKYLTSDKYLLTGDILVNEQHHTCMALTDGANAKGEREVVEQSKLIVNGKEVPVERILKNGTNYIKIRDVAKALDLEVGFIGSIATLDTKK